MTDRARKTSSKIRFYSYGNPHAGEKAQRQRPMAAARRRMQRRERLDLIFGRRLRISFQLAPLSAT